MMEIKEAPCRSILTRTSGYLSRVASHSVNPYSGCGLGNTLCGVGCYVQSSPWVTRGRSWGGFVDIKTNAAEIYLNTVDKECAWANKNMREFVLFLSSATEPWQPAERKWRVTRTLLQAMQEKPPQGLILQTHSTSALEDIEWIARLSKKCHLRFHVSIESDRDSLPGLPRPACSVNDRLDMVRRFADRGVSVVVCASPLLPVAEPENFFRRIAESGATAVVIDHFIGGDGSIEGARTLKTNLPSAMQAVHEPSVDLSYRDEIIVIAQAFLPVGVSSEGFAGKFNARALA